MGTCLPVEVSKNYQNAPWGKKCGENACLREAKAIWIYNSIWMRSHFMRKLYFRQHILFKIWLAIQVRLDLLVDIRDKIIKST